MYVAHIKGNSAMKSARIAGLFGMALSVAISMNASAMAQSRTFTQDPVADEMAAQAAQAQTPAPTASKKLPMETGYYDRFGLPRAKTVRVNGTLVTTAPPAPIQRSYGVSIPKPPRAADNGNATGTPLKTGSAFGNSGTRIKKLQNALAEQRGDKKLPYPDEQK